jgi:hypothetical protein
MNFHEIWFLLKMYVRRMASSGMLRRMTLVRNHLSEELSGSIFGVTRISELGTLAVTSNRRTLVTATLFLVHRF